MTPAAPPLVHGQPNCQRVLLLWTAPSPNGRINDGVDTSVFSEGQIRLQTVPY
jgi:hypothetical protein